MLVEGTSWTKAWILKEQQKGQHTWRGVNREKVLENDVGRGGQRTDNEGASWIIEIIFYCEGKPLKCVEQHTKASFILCHRVENSRRGGAVKNGSRDVRDEGVLDVVSVEVVS